MNVPRPAAAAEPQPTAERESRARTTVHEAAPDSPARRCSAGAEIVAQGVHFRVWAPERAGVEVVLEGEDARTIALSPEPEADGYWSATVPGIGAGARYRLRLNGDDLALPDPFSRYQPEGPHGPSEVIDPAAFRWSDAGWKGVSIKGQIVYELHVGTFSPTGNWAGAIDRLKHLRELGVTVLQVMPVAEFPGEFGWGYDGVDLFAPYHHYGRPDDFRRFVDEAHRLGLAVILDVVYNHFGPDGNYLTRFSPHYFAERETEWGRAVNYDGPSCEGARRLVLDNVTHWISEYHLDGLRLDATQCIYDDSAEHILTALASTAREAARAQGREIIIVAENEPQHARLVRAPEDDGNGLDAIYNEDFHHSAVVAATGRREGYYSEHLGSAQELLSAVKHGFLFQGQLYHWQRQPRGEPMRGLPRWHGAAFLENHDQVANSSTGERLWQGTSPGRHRALTALLLLGPWTPMMFQGAEWNARTPFHYFADHKGELRGLVRKGRAQFLAQFPSAAPLEAQAALPDPGDRAIAEGCRLPWQDRELPAHAAALRLHRDLIKLRRQDPTIAAQGEGGVLIDGAVLAPECFLVRFVAPEPENDRLLLVNLGPELRLVPAPEPLLAAPQGYHWQPIFSSNERAYGGPGSIVPESARAGWVVPAHNAALLRPTLGPLFASKDK